MLTDRQAQLLLEPNFAHVATLRPDGSPNVTVLWVDWDGEHVLLNTALDRAKARHLRRDPRIALDVIDRATPYRYVGIGGKAQLVLEGAEEHIHKLSRKYNGRNFTLRPGEHRIIIRVTPERVHAFGVDP